ncbi:LuxR C-terminal-related transcriptional regulator [Streptomyces tailanensis]|uniref:LuxR C-terminal-related transcriptional regulator n=1 Tax=Streptomyces tailanensis TaxID=2569858 RepID=UPI00155A613B
MVLRHLPHTLEHAVERRELMLRRARALGACGRQRESRDLLHQLIARPDRAERGTVSRASAVVLCAVMEHPLGRYSEAVTLLRRELHRADPPPSPADQVALGVQLGNSAPHDASYPQGARRRGAAPGRVRLPRGRGERRRALPVAAPGEAYGLAELTAREWEIAGLVAEGLTSPAIAERLFLSRRTAETHISRVTAPAFPPGPPWRR